MEKYFTLFSRSFSWEPSLRQWMEMDAAGKTGKLTQQEFRKPLSRSVSYQALDELDVDIFEPRDCKQRYQAAEDFMTKLLEPLANSNDATYSQISCAVSEQKEEC